MVDLARQGGTELASGIDPEAPREGLEPGGATAEGDAARLPVGSTARDSTLPPAGDSLSGAAGKSAPRIRIKHISGVRANAEDTFGLHEHDMLTLGRDPASHIAFDSERDDTVSRRHAAIAVDRRRDDVFELFDLGSANGVFVNGKKLDVKGKIKHGDVIRVGLEGPEIEFLLDPPPVADPQETRIISARERSPLLQAALSHLKIGDPDRPPTLNRQDAPFLQKSEQRDRARESSTAREQGVQSDLPGRLWERVKRHAVPIVVGLVIALVAAFVIVRRDAHLTPSLPTASLALEEAAKAYGQGDFVRAFREFKVLAEKGDPEAATVLGVMYAEGRGTPRDNVQALEWSGKAANQGNSRAQYNMGFLYENGIGVVQNFAQAASWYEKAAAKGETDAMTNLGLLYIAGQAAKKDVAKGVALLQRAADQGNAKAQSKLGMLLINGADVSMDKATGLAWIQKAAAQGDPAAQFELGAAYERGDGVAKNPAEAVGWYQKSAQQGYANAQYKLGSMVAAGAGTAPDLARAYMWLALAADQGNAEAKAKRDYLAGRLLSPAQLAEGQRLAGDWKRKADSK